MHHFRFNPRTREGATGGFFRVPQDLKVSIHAPVRVRPSWKTKSTSLSLIHIFREADHETPASRVDTLLKTVIARNTNAIGEVMADAINRNREGQQ